MFNLLTKTQPQNETPELQNDATTNLMQGITNYNSIVQTITANRKTVADGNASQAMAEETKNWLVNDSFSYIHDLNIEAVNVIKARFCYLLQINMYSICDSIIQTVCNITNIVPDNSIYEAFDNAIIDTVRRVTSDDVTFFLYENYQNKDLQTLSRSISSKRLASMVITIFNYILNETIMRIMHHNRASASEYETVLRSIAPIVVSLKTIIMNSIIPDITNDLQATYYKQI